MTFGIQLTLEQYRFELWGFTYIQIFFFSNSCSTVLSEVGSLRGCGTLDMRCCLYGRLTVNYMQVFNGSEGWHS